MADYAAVVETEKLQPGSKGVKRWEYDLILKFCFYLGSAFTYFMAKNVSEEQNITLQTLSLSGKESKDCQKSCKIG